MKMKNTLSKSEIQVENLKMWLTEQIERYEARSLLFKDSPTIGNMYTLAIAVSKDALARLTEDEKKNF